MKKLLKVELTKEEWTEVIVALYSLQYNRRFYEKDKEKTILDIEIADCIQDQVSQEISINEKSR